MKNRIVQGTINKRKILGFLEKNYRWYSIFDLVEEFDISYSSVLHHCQDATDLGILEETVFYKHNRNRQVSRLHYRYRR